MAARILIILALGIITVAGAVAAQTPDPEAVLGEARRLAAGGQHEEALEKFIWFHEHALETKKWLYGVRLSFALSDWVKLGKRYPKALQALKGIRDRDAAKLLRGEGGAETFHDIQAINDALGEASQTLPFFRRLAEAQPDLATKCWKICESTAIGSGEYALGRQFIKDPDARFLAAKSKLEKDSSSAGVGSRDDALEYFADDVCALVEILAGNGEDDLAEKFEAAAIAVAKDRRVEVAVKHARRTGNHRRAGGTTEPEKR